MYVHERMTRRPTVVMPDYSVAKAYQLMKEGRFSQLPVVDSDNKLIGLVTEKLLAEVNPSSATSLSVYEINYLLSKTKVKDIMKTGIFKINKNALLEDAALVMKENRISSLPVTDGEYLVGIITRTDIFRAFIDIMGVKAEGTRVAISAADKTGVFAEITQIFASYGIDIRNISNINENGRLEMVVKVRSFDVEKAIEDIKAKGYIIESVQEVR
ncbi:MAG: CBS and ACT domain-containing protein [Clostridia bacterium]|nr:CBS and ACT domain-containing protein [Clostridia bacterium]